MIKIEGYNIPVEIPKEIYHTVMDRLSGIVAGRKDENDKYYVKVLIPNDYYVKIAQNAINELIK